MASKPPVGADADPVAGLRAGWELRVGFGLANPGLFRLMHTVLCTPDGRAAAAARIRMLQAWLHWVAEAGRLRVTERRAAGLIRAVGTAPPGLTALTAAERALLGDWLDRIAESQRLPG